jgi:hypothetical protein
MGVATATTWVSCQTIMSVIGASRPAVKGLERAGRIRSRVLPGTYRRYALEDALALAREAEGRWGQDPE